MKDEPKPYGLTYEEGIAHATIEALLAIEARIEELADAVSEVAARLS